jgi:hypothetical protein
MLAYVTESTHLTSGKRILTAHDDAAALAHFLGDLLTDEREASVEHSLLIFRYESEGELTLLDLTCQSSTAGPDDFITYHYLVCDIDTGTMVTHFYVYVEA